MSISLQNISKTFRGCTALDQLSLHIQAGQMTALLGPSGSGKTTLLRLIAGLETPDPGSGGILFQDEDVSTRSASERQVGFVFQHYALFPHLSVFENVAFGLRVRKRRERPSRNEIARRVNALLDLVQLGNMGYRRPSQLSGGQRQRVALARALAIEPRVLLLDEPFGSLDARVRSELRSWLKRLHEDLRFTCVFVTHDQEEALEVSDHVVVMNQGKIEQVGTPDEVFHHPANEFVMTFLGEVNIFHGRQPGSRLLVRPHDIGISLEPTHHPEETRARLRRLQTAGPQVRLFFESQAGEDVTVTLSHERFQDLSLSPGQDCFLFPITPTRPPGL